MNEHPNEQGATRRPETVRWNATKMVLCPECREEADKWLDYRPRPLPRIASSSAYDDTAAGAADNRTARFEAWRALVREQRAKIRVNCLVNHNF